MEGKLKYMKKQADTTRKTSTCKEKIKQAGKNDQ
jgi:hypothetical protein